MVSCNLFVDDTSNALELKLWFLQFPLFGLQPALVVDPVVICCLLAPLPSCIMTGLASCTDLYLQNEKFTIDLIMTLKIIKNVNGVK